MTESLPALLSRAGNRLLEAKSSAEVLEAKKLAEAALHYARVTRAANDTHADCLRIITRAEMRMANEIDRGQEAGEVATDGRPKTAQGSDGLQPSPIAELGISRQRVSEWRQLRDAGEEAVEEALDSIVADGATPTKAALREMVVAAALRGLKPERKARAINPMYEANPAYNASASIDGSCTSIAGLVEEHGADFILSGCIDGPMLQRSVAKMTRARDALNRLLEAAHEYQVHG